MGSVGLNREFHKTAIGIFEIATFVLSLISLTILVSTEFWIYTSLQMLHAGIFTFTFIVITQLIGIFVNLLQLYNLSLLSKLPWKILDIVYAIICAILLAIAMGVCAYMAAIFWYWQIATRVACCAVFAANLLLAFLIYAFITFRGGVSRQESPSSVNT